LMNVQPKAVAGSMKESLHASIHQARRETFGRKIVEDLVMNVVCACTVTDSAEADLLPTKDTMIGVFQPFGIAAANNGGCNGAEVAGRLRTRKDVHDDGRIRANRPASLIVRIDALIA